LRVHYSSDFITIFVCILHKFAYSQIKQDVSDSGHYLTTGFSRLVTFKPPAPPPPLPICQYDGTINDCHTSGRFHPLFSWEMPVPSREYDSCFLVSHSFGHVLGLENLHVPIVFILGNVLELDEWHLHICYQNTPFPGKMPVPSQECVVFQLFR
jgi:hypothetical protein